MKRLYRTTLQNSLKITDAINVTEKSYVKKSGNWYN